MAHPIIVPGEFAMRKIIGTCCASIVLFSCGTKGTPLTQGECEATAQKEANHLASRSGRDFRDEMRHLLEKTGHWQGKIWCTGKDGKPRLQWLTLDTVYRRRY